MSPVIINEFEVVAAPEARGPADGNGTSGADAGGAAPASQPQAPVQEIERVMQRRVERLLRVWAH